MHRTILATALALASGCHADPHRSTRPQPGPDAAALAALPPLRSAPVLASAAAPGALILEVSAAEAPAGKVAAPGAPRSRKGPAAPAKAATGGAEREAAMGMDEAGMYRWEDESGALHFGSGAQVPPRLRRRAVRVDSDVGVVPLEQASGPAQPGKGQAQGAQGAPPAQAGTSARPEQKTAAPAGATTSDPAPAPAAAPAQPR